MAYLIVEKIFAEPLSDDNLNRMFSDLGPCLNQYQAQWIHSYLSNDRMRMVCTFEAADAESVRMAHRVAGIDFERVWPARKLTRESGSAKEYTGHQ